MNDRVVVITGGGSGIGRAAAMQFAESGARVAIVGRRAEPLEATARESSQIVPFPGDILLDDDRQRIIDGILNRWGRIDILVNNAGIFAERPLAAIDQPLISSLFAVNVFGPSLVSQAALPSLIDSQGSIVNVTSTFGHKSAPNFSHYSASKAALEQLTRCWAVELAPHHVRVNAIAPGPTETEILKRSGLSAAAIDEIKRAESKQSPLGRRGTAEEIAAWIVKLASPDASWITGQVWSIDGGLSAT